MTTSQKIIKNKLGVLGLSGSPQPPYFGEKYCYN